MTINVIDYRRFWYGFSGLLIALSVLAVAVWGLKFGIDFTGGSLMEIQAPGATTSAQVHEAFGGAGYPSASVQQTGEGRFLVRTDALDETPHQALLGSLKEKFGEVSELRFDSIGPVIGQELRRTATIGVILTLALIGLYIAWAFRSSGKETSAWKYGAITVITAFHDVVIPIGAFAVLGHFYGFEVGTAFVAAALTILGYSINDTVVVLDRTRENLRNRVSPYLDETVQTSVNQTWARSLNTSATTLLALLAVFLFGGETTRAFALALLLGIGVGAYSSIFIASPLLVTWSKRGNRQ